MKKFDIALIAINGSIAIAWFIASDNKLEASALMVSSFVTGFVVGGSLIRNVYEPK